MRCSGCNQDFRERLAPFEDGRRIVHLCPMCKAQWEWKRTEKVPPPPEKFSIVKWLKKIFGL
ncbi:MAG: hypothetical protein M1536_04930 [Firmicutes bacterium]|nr:hypothetical protein [Bacillota bacterium]